MPFIDMATYRRACEKAEEGVDHMTLMEAIFRIYDMWIRDKDEGKKINFHSYFTAITLELGIEDLFEAKKYRLAFAAYFQPRALKKLAELRQLRPERPVKESSNPVKLANSMRVVIKVSEAVSFQFRATRRTGPLKWRHVDEQFKIIHFGDGEVDDTIRHHARKQALEVLNSVRERRPKRGVG